jgi:hypothetical protein
MAAINLSNPFAPFEGALYFLYMATIHKKWFHEIYVKNLHLKLWWSYLKITKPIITK